MIVGSGLLAEAFRERYGNDASVTIHAAGVSNSAETDPAQFERERRGLEASLAQAPGHFVYFSSCVVGLPYSTPSPYVQHKARMEALVMAAHSSAVFRLPQVVGRTGNPNTLTNYLASRILEGRPFSIYSGAQRNLVDVDDIAAIVPELLADPLSMGTATCIAARDPVAVPVLVAMLEQVLGRTACATVVPRDEPFVVDAARALAVSSRLGLGLEDGQDYVMKILRKYYG
jgi:nucleoside-diphosphate-sugar epimerase